MKARAPGLLLLTCAAFAQAGPAPVPPPWQRTLQPLRMTKPAPHPAPTAASASTPAAAAAAAPARARDLPGIRYLGSLQQGATRFLFAEVNGQVYSVRTGSDLGGLYRLEAIDQRQARFVYLPTHEDILVSLD